MSKFTKIIGAGPVISYDGELLKSVKANVRGELRNCILSRYEDSLHYDNYKTLIIHHDDSDGYCSAAVISSFERYMMKSSIECICISNYSEDMSKYQSKIEEASVVYLVDLSFKKLQIDYLVDHSNVLIWIDHHISSMSVDFESYIINAYNFIYSEKGISAAALCWIYVGEMICAIRDIVATGILIVPEIVEYVSLYDTFHPDMNEDFYYGINTVGYNYPWSLETLWGRLIDPYMSTLQTDECNSEDYETAKNIIDDILEKGSISKLYMNNFYSHYRKNNLAVVPITTVDKDSEKREDYKIAIMNIDANSFAFGDEYNHYDAVIKYTYQNDGKYHYSMYANDKNPHSLDCRKVAESFGGGGHKGAAGWISDRNLMQEFLNGENICITITISDN